LSVPDEPISLERHIKPLFREGDRQSMKSAFDLWSHDGQVGDLVVDRCAEEDDPLVEETE